MTPAKAQNAKEAHAEILNIREGRTLRQEILGIRNRRTLQQEIDLYFLSQQAELTSEKVANVAQDNLSQKTPATKKTRTISRPNRPRSLCRCVIL
ncbi:MAG: hypothetical protein SP4CHLAM5_12160 [Chlamydiia bacterium]|nr:hypothetical protein [Chlamydiia bacterium]MCH9623859.1 hypothetical protein [Chlamydiia bacterium]